MAVGVLIHIHRKADDSYFTILFGNTVETRFYKIYYLAKQCCLAAKTCSKNY